MVGNAWGNKLFATVVGSLYDRAMQHDQVGNWYLQFIVGESTQGLLGAMDVVAQMPDGSAILDVPCGGGITLRRLRPEQRLRYVAADVSPTMLRRARQHIDAGSSASAELVQCDITCMPFADSEFDLIVCFSGLHCLPDPAAAVREIARCVRPGGRVIADVALERQLRRTDISMALGRCAGVFGPPATSTDVRRWFSDAELTISNVTRAGALAYVEAHRS